jgi:6-phosphogluconolactonase
MKPLHTSHASFLCLFLVAVGTAFASTPIVTVTSPANNSSDGSPVSYVASATSPRCAKGISAMRIYIADGVSAYTVDSNQINTKLKLQPGSYSTVVQAWDNCGGVGKTTVKITVKNGALKLARYLYVTDEANQIIWGYTVNPSTGSLTLNGQGPVSTGPLSGCCYPFQLASDKSGYRLYATAGDAGNEKAGFVYGYFIYRNNGYIYPVPGNPVAANYLLGPIAVHSSGKFVFVGRVLNQPEDGIDVFKVNGDGSLTLVPGSPFATQEDPGSLAIDPSGRYLYAASNTANAIDAFAIDATSGALTPLAGSPYAVASGTCSTSAGTGSVVDPFGLFVYTADGFANAISGFAIHSSTGTLTQAAGSPYPDYPCSTSPFDQGNPAGLAIEGTGRFLYAANTAPTISIYSINAGNGALTFLKYSPAQFGTYCGPEMLWPDPSGNFIYTFAPHSGCGEFNVDRGNIIGFSVNHSTGDLTPVPGSPYSIPTTTSSSAMGSGIAITP